MTYRLFEARKGQFTSARLLPRIAIYEVSLRFHEMGDKVMTFYTIREEGRVLKIPITT
jgi:hypothetical protein